MPSTPTDAALRAALTDGKIYKLIHDIHELRGMNWMTTEQWNRTQTQAASTLRNALVDVLLPVLDAALRARETETPPYEMHDGTTLSRAGYERLFDEDIEWVEQQPRTLERDHVIQVLRWARANRRTIDQWTAPRETETPAEPATTPCGHRWEAHADRGFWRCIYCGCVSHGAVLNLDAPTPPPSHAATLREMARSIGEYPYAVAHTGINVEFADHLRAAADAMERLEQERDELSARIANALAQRRHRP